MNYPVVLRRLLAQEDLGEDEAAELIGAVMDGAVSSVQAAGLLVALASKGERPREVLGAARAMRARSLHVTHELPMVVDVVGTGGDAANTVNISTMAALVVAGAGIPVAKHGNRAASSKCGSADVLEHRGLSLDFTPEVAAGMLATTGFTFMFAPLYHPAMKNVAPVRRELGVRTMFNILGPLTNPASATHQVVGVARPELLEPVGDVLRGLGVHAGAVVHGWGGIDEIAGDGPTAIYSFDERGTRRWDLDPAEFGVSASASDIQGGSLEACAAAFDAILAGERSPRADVVALNAAVALQVCDRAQPLAETYALARETLASGAAMRIFQRAKAVANG